MDTDSKYLFMETDWNPREDAYLIALGHIEAFLTCFDCPDDKKAIWKKVNGKWLQKFCYYFHLFAIV